jgi:hypothetical protein
VLKDANQVNLKAEVIALNFMLHPYLEFLALEIVKLNLKKVLHNISILEIL